MKKKYLILLIALFFCITLFFLIPIFTKSSGKLPVFEHHPPTEISKNTTTDFMVTFRGEQPIAHRIKKINLHYRIDEDSSLLTIPFEIIKTRESPGGYVVEARTTLSPLEKEASRISYYIEYEVDKFYLRSIFYKVQIR